MEVTVRVFAGELNQCSCTLDGRTPHRPLVSPSGAVLSRIFHVGAVTEVRESGHGTVKARVSDPTGTLQLYAGKENPDVAASLLEITVPAFVALTGTVRSYRTPAGIQYSVLPEALGTVNRMIRDLWVLRTAEMTLERLETMQSARDGGDAPPGTAAALGHYAITPASLAALASLVDSALDTTRIPPDAGRILCLDPSREVLDLIAEHSGPRGMSVDDLLEHGTGKGISPATVRRIINELMAEGDCYSPCTGFIKLL
jgi:RPA family protein